jgi:hypothetical protein
LSTECKLLEDSLEGFSLSRHSQAPESGMADEIGSVQVLLSTVVWKGTKDRTTNHPNKELPTERFSYG